MMASGVEEQTKGASGSAGLKHGCVLLVDDDAATRELVARWLTGAGIASKQASSGHEALAMASEHPEEFAAVVLDIMMPGMDGFEVAARLKANAATAILPVVVLTAHAMTDDDIVKGIDFGAVDHMAKPFSGPVLVAKIRSAIARTVRERAIMAKLDSAESHARIDALTGLFNRRHFVLRLREESAHAARHRRPFSVVMFDIDHFKSINDGFGHDEGDRVLIFVANTALHVLRIGDQAFRYGGEEFMLLLRECDAAMATRVADRLRAELRAHPVILQSQERIVTFSAGIAAADSTNDYSSPDLVSNADAALYRAKGAGRDCVKIF
jgi:two-component system cell cycle response regulator